MLPLKQTIRQVVEARAKTFGSRTYLMWQEEELSFAQLDKDANRISHVLTEMGVVKGDRVGVLLGNCPLHVSLFFGIAKVGAILVPVNPLYAVEEMIRVLCHSGARGLVFAESFWPKIEKVRDSCPDLKWLLVSGQAPASSIERLETRLEMACDSAPPEITEPDDEAAIIYTSGTTGVPKGVLLTHWNYVVNAYQSSSGKRMSPNDRFLTALPLCHVAAQVGAMLSSLYAGASLVLLESFSPEKFLAAIEKYRATVCGGVPTIYAILLNVPNHEKYDLSSLRFCNTSAASMPPELAARVEREFHVRLVEGYGLTEGTCSSATNPVDGLRKPCSIGLPYEGQRVRIIGEGGREMPSGEVGELAIQGPNVMKGYYKDPQTTTDVMRDGWLLTGDLAYRDEEGYLFLVGRKKDVIIRGASKIYPRDVEAVIYRNQKVQEVAVVGLSDPIWGERVHACIISKCGKSIPEDEVISLCKESMAGYKVPSSVSFHEDFPRTSARKVKRGVLAETVSNELLKNKPIERIVMKGCEAVGEAAIRVGCHAFFGYPITPSNELCEYMSSHMPKLGRVFIQPNSEIVAIYMVYGASATGFRAMTASSGPGISLMQEGLSYLCAAELPAVIANFCRNGPGLSGISGSQVDYFQAVKGGGHGGYRLIVLAPKDAQEAVTLTYEAFDLADQYRNPVMLFCDGFIAQIIESIAFPPYKNQKDDKPWAVCGKGDGSRRRLPQISPAREIPPVLVAKYEKIEAEQRRYEQTGSGKDVLLVAFGTPARICESVIETATNRGIDVGLFRPITLFPFPAPELKAASSITRHLLVVELNYGQMVEDVRLAVGDLKPISFLGKAGGIIPKVQDILRRIEEIHLQTTSMPQTYQQEGKR